MPGSPAPVVSQEGPDPNTDSPDIYAYVKDLVSLGVRTCLWDCVHMKQEGCVLLCGLHVVPQACLEKSQQLCVSTCACMLGAGERQSSPHPASPLLPLSQLLHVADPCLPLFLLHTPLLFFSSSLSQSLPSRFSPVSCPSSLSLAPAWQGAPLAGCHLPPAPSPAGRRILRQTPPCCTPLAPGAGPRAGAAGGLWDPLGSLAGSPLPTAGSLWKLLRSWRR